MDNTIAVLYINRRGGTASPILLQLTKDLWFWCTERNILIQAQHLNTIADTESRAQSDRSVWKLAPPIFKIHQLLKPLSIDLFTSCLSAQLPTYVSWKPDPLAMATDAFSTDWSTPPGTVYANPPWGLIGKSPVNSAQPQGLGDGFSSGKPKRGTHYCCKCWSENH